jgi:hypothetical protein
MERRKKIKEKILAIPNSYTYNRFVWRTDRYGEFHANI